MKDSILATLNGRNITENDLEETISRFPQDKQAYLRTEQGKKQLLEEMLCFELIYDYAKEKGIDSDAEYIDQIEKIKKEVLSQVAINKVLSEINVSDNEVKEFYEKNESMFKSQEAISAKHILVESLEKANEVASKINEGMTFEEAAEKYSTCPSKSQGGSLGEFSRGRMVPEFEEAAFKLEIGAISEPVKTQFGYHLIKVEEKKDASVRPFEEVKDSIFNELIKNKKRSKYTEFTNELKVKYNAEIK